MSADGQAFDPAAKPGLSIERMAADLQSAGIRRVHVLAWRDLDDPDAGGSERHADEFMRRWAAAGLDVLHRTSAAAGLPSMADRNGYRVMRRGSRFGVFPRTVAAEMSRSMGPYDALVEIWNGVPWLSPVWCRRPRITVVHHVHGPMWDQIFPAPLAAVGRSVESRWAPPLYRRTEVVTPSEATRDELVALGFRPQLVTAVNNGVDPFFSPGGERAPWPEVVMVGRLAPVKRFDLGLTAAAIAREQVPDLRVTVIGEGPLRRDLEALVSTNGWSDWVTFRGHVDAAELRAAYRRAHVVLSASLAEGWGLSLTEGAACGTPAVATDISGHRCSVIDGVTGVLAADDQLGATLAGVLLDHDRGWALAQAALDRARTLTWEASATGVLAALHRTALVPRRGRWPR